MFVWKQPYVVVPCKYIHKKIKILKSMKRQAYSQMHHTDEYSQHSSIIWPVWLNGWVFVHELSGCGFGPVAVHEEGLWRVSILDKKVECMLPTLSNEKSFTGVFKRFCSGFQLFL